MEVLQILLVVVIFIFSTFMLYYFGVAVGKEKTYEEALAEQREKSIALLGTQIKSKAKDKKQKKSAKKGKEKPNTGVSEGELEETDVVETAPSDDSTSQDQQLSTQPRIHHVEFKDPAIVEETHKDISKRRSKKDKVRPILLNRDMSEEKIVMVDDDVEMPSANHFEELHPKDEFELMHSHSKDDSPKREFKEKQAKEKSNSEVSAKQQKKAAKLQTAENTTQTVPAKEEVVVQQVSQVTQTNGIVSNSGKEKKKKKPEASLLNQLTSHEEGLNLELLTTLVRKVELSRSEVQILIDMLLNKQHEAPAVRDEWTEGKADPVQRLKKQLAEKEKLLTEEQEALVSAQAKLKEVRAEQHAERSQLQQKMRGLEEALNAKQLELQASNSRFVSFQQKQQPLQDQLNNELMTSQKLMEDNAGFQMQIQQLQLMLSQAKEKEITTEHQQGIIAQLQHQTALMKNDLDQKDGFIRQLEEAHKDAEHRFTILQRQENDCQVEISQLQSTCQKQLDEIRHFELNQGRSLNDLQDLKQNQDELETTIEQLRCDMKRIKEEKEHIEASKANGALEEQKAHQVEIKNLQNELSSLKSQLQQNESKHSAELDATVKKLQSELEEQKEKNNDLRKKNWKVMEALNEAENRNKALLTSNQKNVVNVDETIAKIREEEQTLNKQLIQRLFPDLKISDGLPHEKWCSQAELAIIHYVDNLKKPKTPEPVDNSEMNKLQNEIRHYKAVIDETENELNKIQTHAESTEIQWRKELEKKDAELAVIHEQLQQLREKLAEQQSQLESEKQIRQRLFDECNTFRTKENSRSDTTVEIEKLTEQLNRLSKHLEEEQRKSSELQNQLDAVNNTVKTLSHSSTANGPAVAAEPTLSSTSSAASSVSEINTNKSKSKKKRKKITP